MSPSLHTFLFTQKNAASVSLFRILFGSILLYQSIYYISIDYTFQFMSGPQMLFSYPFLEFIKPLPETVLKALLYGMPIATIMVIFGWCYRIALVYLLLVLGYFTFIDTTLYNNHLYLFLLVILVMIFIDADKKFSIANNKKRSFEKIPAWNIYLLQFLIVLVYFYGGLAKLNPDWLNTSIPAAILRSNGIESTFLLFMLTYGGLVFDLLIGFLLLYTPTRWFGVVLAVVFNLSNGWMLFNDIGVFPYFMISSVVLFFPPPQIQKWVDRIWTKKPSKIKGNKKKQSIHLSSKQTALPALSWTKKQLWITFALAAFVSFHLVFPFRHHILTDNPEWTGIASRFAWRMKLQTRKLETIEMTITDKKTGQAQAIDYQSFLSTNQQRMFINDPFCFVQLAKHLHAQGVERGMEDPIVKAKVEISFNGRPAQLMLNPDIDLSKIEVNPFGDTRWIMPLEER